MEGGHRGHTAMTVVTLRVSGQMGSRAEQDGNVQMLYVFSFKNRQGSGLKKWFSH